ncbi:MAG: hypothetical protein V1861_00950 [Candidatus Micrarchaeota archaeon]
MKKTIALFAIFLLSLGYAQVPADTTKAVIAHMNIKDDIVTVLGTDIVYNYPPEHVVEYPFIKVKVLAADGSVADEYGILDPRLGLAEEGAITLDDVNFTLVLPFYTNMKTLELRDYESNALMGSMDLSEQIDTFCSENSYADPDCRLMDLDNDAIKDMDDPCPRSTGPFCGISFVWLAAALVLIIVVALVIYTRKPKK